MTVGGLPSFDPFERGWQSSARPSPGSQYREPGLNPFSPDVLHGPLNTLADVRKRIDAYDKKTTGDYFIESTAPWMARNLVAQVGQNIMDKSPYSPLVKSTSQEIYEALPKSLSSWADSKITYHELFNIFEDSIEKPAEMTWREFATDKNVQKLYKEVVYDNFKDFQLPSIKPTEYFKHVIAQYNIGNVVADLKEGRFFPAIAKSLGIGTLFYNVKTRTKEVYDQEKAKEDGSLTSQMTTFGKTLWGFGKELVQSVTAWELGRIGFMVGSSLFCIGTIPKMVSGILFGGLFEAGFKKLCNSSSHDQFGLDYDASLKRLPPSQRLSPVELFYFGPPLDQSA